MNLAQGVREGMDRGHEQSKVTAAVDLHGHQGLRKANFLFGSFCQRPEVTTKNLKMHPDPYVTAQTGLDSEG